MIIPLARFRNVANKTHNRSFVADCDLLPLHSMTKRTIQHLLLALALVGGAYAQTPAPAAKAAAAPASSAPRPPSVVAEPPTPTTIRLAPDSMAVAINSQKFTKTANIWGVANNAKGTTSNRIVLFRKPV